MCTLYRDLIDNNTFISLGERINCTGNECIDACKTLNSTIDPDLGSTINSTEPCVVIVKNVNHQPHCEGKPKGSISVQMTRALCMRAVQCPSKGKRRGCSCCSKKKFKYSKCKNDECSHCATASASPSYGKLY